MRQKNNYGISLTFLWLKFFLMRFKAKGDAKEPARVLYRISSCYEDTLSKLALMAKAFLESFESLFMMGVVSEPELEEVPEIDEDSEVPIIKQKAEISAITQRNAQKQAAYTKAMEGNKELDVKKIELQNAFEAVFEKAHSFADVYLARVAPFSAENFDNPFDVVPNISDFISLVKGDEHEMVQKENS